MGWKGWSKANLRTLAVTLCVSTTIQSGCAHFIVRPTDSAATVSGKVVARAVGGVATIGASEVYVYAAKKNEEIARATDPAYVKKLQEDRDGVVNTYWGVWAAIVIVVLVVAVVAAKAGGNDQSKQRVIHTPPGTCSWHGGVADCVGGVATCKDGEVSPGLQPCSVTWE